MPFYNSIHHPLFLQLFQKAYAQFIKQFLLFIENRDLTNFINDAI